MLTDKQIRRGVHRSTEALERDIRAFINAHNANPKPFRWTKPADDILASRLRDWAIAERRQTDGVLETAPDALPNEKARPIALRRQLEGVVRMTRGEPHQLATFAEALAVQEAVESILIL